MVYGSLTRSDWYSLFLANRKWEKRYPLPSGMERDYWYPLPSLAENGVMVWSGAHSASSISQSSGTSGSSSAGVEDVAGWAGEVVDGARISVREKEQDGRMGSLLASARGNESVSENGRGGSDSGWTDTGTVTGTGR